MKKKQVNRKGENKYPRVTIRVNQHILLRLNDLANITGQNLSVVVRMFIVKGLKEITNSEGNIKTGVHR